MLVFVALALLGVRIATVVASGAALHQSEVAGREMAQRIVVAELKRRADAPAGDPITPYAFLSTLVAEGRLTGLLPVAHGKERDLWRNESYVFHVRLLNKLGRPLTSRPERPELEPGLGANFELWAWPFDRKHTTLSLFFASDVGALLQGDNGVFAGIGARPEEVQPLPPRTLEKELDGAGKQWIVVSDHGAP